MSDTVESHTHVIDTRPGAARPLRAELLSAERLADEARVVAAAQRWTTEEPPRTTPLLGWMADAADSLARDNANLAKRSRGGVVPVSPAGEWLLDNYYLIEEQINLVQKICRRTTASSFRGSPKVRSPTHLAFMKRCCYWSHIPTLASTRR